MRPRLCLAAAVAVGGDLDDALMPACAIELLHSYTLVHDDLPAMDNDRERRGRQSVWAKFGEATAILAGDALQTLAFSLLAKTPERYPGVCASLLRELGKGGFGVVCGQVDDLAFAAGAKIPPERIYERKTADLFRAAVCMGAVAGGGTEADVAALDAYAMNAGIAFQHRDDVLDGESPFGTEAAKRRMEECAEAALKSLDALHGDVSPLADFVRWICGNPLSHGG